MWRRFAYIIRVFALPPAVFVGASVMAWWLWQHQAELPQTYGTVEAVRVEVAAATEGMLATNSDPGWWTLFDSVTQDTVIARLDDRPSMARLVALRAELKRLEQEVTAAAARIDVEYADQELQQRREAIRLAWNVERLRLDVLDRKTLLETSRIEQQRLSARVAYLEPLVARGAITDMELVDASLLRDETEQRVNELKVSLVESEQQQKRAVERMAEFTFASDPQLAAQLAPLRSAVDVQAALIEELKIGIELLEVRAPVSGEIVAIHRYPGQNVQAGDPVVTIAATKGRYIVSYVRSESNLQPTQDMSVRVRRRVLGGLSVKTTVGRIGPQVELVPTQQRRDPNRPEWGRPVRIRMPQDLVLVPGELVEISFGSTLLREKKFAPWQ
jgi:multidrug resistance efflux pump